MSIGIWAERSWQVIDELDKNLPLDLPLNKRIEALKEAYPFGERRFFPWRAWCKARKQYLARFQPPKPIPEHLLEGWK